MSNLEPEQPARKLPKIAFIVVIVIIGLLAVGYFLPPRFERGAPHIKLPDVDVLGSAPVEIVVADRGVGLKSVNVTLSVGGSELTLVSEQYSQPLREKKIGVSLSPKLAGIKEGPAVLRVSARDASLWNFFEGNERVVQKHLSVDLTPPRIELVANDRYVTFGGVGVIVYKASADTATSGVRLGDHFFPGFRGQVKGHPDYFVDFFAHAYDVPADAKARIVATDKAGNAGEMPLDYELKNVKYRNRTIAVPDGFIQKKVAPLLKDAGARQDTPKDIFVAVNHDLRKANEDKIAAVTSKATPSMLWSGAFTQLSNSKVEANFADHRTYTYNGEEIDKAYHLGYDLSVTKHYPIEASNSGVVAFAGDLGIYGNAVILDHGLGLFTLYGHMSQIDVKVGDAVKQKQILGKTGETGLAAGDHLHFGVYLDGVAVLPVEWWDPKWIAENVTSKLEGRGMAAAASPQPSERHETALGAVGKRR